ncbi:hypothetical protein ANN_00573 [Periplaneta americana]|uniref:Uncharacterized protein n=1 Tax=Periplaneta americana TaxID=6978 RepID=A0ABQ8TU07_PERAM|nr:hypothetical protein ANN_00573 [Periplaneta americana]
MLCPSQTSGFNVPNYVRLVDFVTLKNNDDDDDNDNVDDNDNDNNNNNNNNDGNNDDDNINNDDNNGDDDNDDDDDNDGDNDDKDDDNHDYDDNNDNDNNNDVVVSASRNSLRPVLSSFNFSLVPTVILPVVLYGCETWTLTLREEHRLRVFENEVLRKIFGAKRDEVTGEWRKLHNTELHALYSSPDIIRNIKSRRLRWAGHVARMGESRNAYRVLVGRPEGKRPLGRPRRRWEDNIKMDLREVGYDDRDWINLAQDRDQWRAYVRAAMNLRVP